MVDQGNRPGAQFAAWQYLYLAAMRVALVQKEPYPSLRTLWQDAGSRGFCIDEMLSCLTKGDIRQLPKAVDTVQYCTGSWGKPDDVKEPFIRPK